MGDLVEFDAAKPHIRLTVGRDQLVFPVELACEWANGHRPLPDRQVLRAIIGAWLDALDVAQRR